MDIFQLFELHHLLFLVFGLLLGIFVGALPGLTPTMGVALTIPFTFSLGPTEGLIILGGIYCGSVYGGSIPAILFNVPGAPASVATTFDGYPMTKNGQGRKALELATIASVIGGLFGMILLLFFAPVFADFSLRFGPTESFWIALFGITVIAAISEGSVTKNMIGGSIGILLSFIGISSITGTTRFTIGMDSLVGGLHIVAVLIGLFAFPQALRLIEQLPLKEKEKSKEFSVGKQTVKASFMDIIKKPKAVSIGSGLGALVGMIPGAGGNIASILAYNEVKRFSKNKRKFGKGEKKGVIASESANNAMVGGSLIPLLTLGIPGSPTAAIFLGGLLIHGIWPGRNLFVENADVAYTFLYSLLAAQLVLLVLGLAIIKPMMKLTRVPSEMMAPVILSFTIIGAYTTQNNMFDIYTVVFLGLTMFFLQKYGFSPAPIALGFILGPIAEQGLLHGIQVGGANGNVVSYFFTGSLNIILFCLVLITVIFSLFQSFSLKRDLKVLSVLKSITWKGFMSIRAIRWLFAAGINVWLIYYVFQMEFQQMIFPLITLLFLLFFIFVEYVNSLFVTTQPNKPKKHLKSKDQGIILSLLLSISILMLLTTVIGFYFQVLLLMIIVPFFAYFKNWKNTKPRTIVVTAILFTLMMYIVFAVVLRVPL
ncbi:tripartite tricarboxylate transporter permease [Evansella tamaricis]|uniref:Tripartite tricarboxylate transporter permease n=1 Tax=Evansella tamaricis TaxID=2069301 RepID=A0ABS6JKK5_9BACI|nr:tripartite tricarboxylate transporter permease [Evansella tamaricis]MBU9714078.1 tripartite tricarboxylate transporter permease [Evansella tamaricis]